ncbi:MAG TPA: hypothetical protein VHY56_04640 [Candidatus Binataceae bacterium]|nr:hypothetical protein [Candidatus Binataceae bacterium]
MLGAKTKAVPAAAGDRITIAVPPGNPSASPRVPRTIGLFHYAPGLILILIAIADAHQLTDPDLWGHILFGRTALAAGHLTNTDPYSYSAFGMPWHNHEWLTELLMGWLYNTLGVIGLKIWKFSCAGATIVLLTDGLGETGASASLQVNLLLVAALAIMPQMQFRPQLFTFAMMAAMIALLARHTYRGHAPLWLMIPIMMLWANLHGGFVIGVAVLLTYTGITAAREVMQYRRYARGLRLSLLAIACIAATFATPYGIGTWTTVIHALRNPVTRKAVTDWHPMLFAMAHQWHVYHPGVIYYLCVLGILTAFVTGLILAPARDDPALSAIAIVMAIAAFAAVRNMPLAVIACVVPAAHHLGIASRCRTTKRLMQSPTESATLSAAPFERSPMNQWLLAVTACAFAIYLGLFSTHIAEDSYYPAAAVAFIRANHLHGNLLGDFGWGEYLIWHLAPQAKVFIDGRYDTVYQYSVINDYIKFAFATTGGLLMLQHYPHDLILIPPNTQARRLLDHNSNWKLIYSDDGSRLYARAGSAPSIVRPSTPADPRKLYFTD